MQKAVVSTDKAPKAIGPYSQAIAVGEFIFLSGQVALDPATGELIQGTVAEQAEQALKNLKAVVEAAGSSLEKIVKTTIYLIDMSDFSTVNEVYATFFQQEPPARATVAVSGLPRGAKIEIEAVATK
ncbi:MAG: RidA family protein [Blastocatellia bacterium]|nr:RidA family protein [Blastocatellia bacterium]